MRSQNQAVAESSKCYQLFGSSATRVSLSPNSVRIESNSGRPVSDIPIDSVAKILVEQSWFWYRLKIESTDGRRYSVGGLDGRGAASIRDAALEIAEQLAHAEFANLLRLDEQRLELFDGSRYVRHREAMEFHEAIVSTLPRSKGIVRQKLAEIAQDVLTRIQSLESAEGFELAR
ncbi:MAG: hypothetical protein F4Y88_04165, partial [Chloroflexi bacterium]|nr:hypothetical protein [Chloroflexota bacterium]